MSETHGQPGRTILQRNEEEAPGGANRQGHSDAAARASRRSTDSSGPTSPVRALRACRYLGAAACLLSGAAVACMLLRPEMTQAHQVLIAAVVVLLATLVVAQYRNERHTSRLAQAYQRAHQLAELNSSVIASFAMAIDAKDQHTHGHTQRVHDIAVMVAEDMGLTDGEIDALSTAAMLHDIGKLAVPDYILSKPGTLTQEEKKKVRTHTLVGGAILESVKFPWPVVPLIRSHHEWYDGSGYPDGLAGDQIPLAARVLAVADVYGALLSNRPYRPAKTVQEAVTFMRERAGTQFDPEILNTCFRVLSSRQAQGRFGFIIDADGAGLDESTQDAAGQRAIFMDIRQAHQELLALYEIVQTMGQSLNMQETASLIISKTKGIIDFATCVLFLRQPEDDQILAVAASGPHSEAIQGQRLPLGGGVSGAVALTGASSSLDSSASDDLSLLLGANARECSLTEVLAAPLIGDTGAIGTITLYRTKERPFTDDDARLVSTVARQATIAVTNAGKYEETKQSALTDQLTGLANARYFFMRLEEELVQGDRQQTPVSLIAIDVDKLKAVNDNYGHQQGDRVLRILAEIFRRYVRESDTVVRYAGDEFFIILPDTGNKRALDTAERIKSAVRDTSVDMLSDRVVSLSASFGVATFPGDATDAQGLIAVADRLMYADKRLHQQVSLLSGQGKSDEQEKVASIKRT